MIFRRIFDQSPWEWRTSFDDWEKEMDRLRRGLFLSSTAGVFPLVNVTEDEQNYYVRAELPGVKADDLEITANGNSLSLAGERKIGSEGDQIRYHRREREAGRFSRKLGLPGDIDNSKVEAGFKEGVLTVKLPKAEVSKPRQINIK